MTENIDSNIDEIRADMASLKEGISSLLSHLKVGASVGAQNAAERVDDETRSLYRGIVAGSERSLRAIEAQIEVKPVVAVIIAVGIGYLGGRLLAR